MGEPAPEERDSRGHRVLTLGLPESRRAAEQPQEGDRGQVGHEELRRVRVRVGAVALVGSAVAGVAVDVRQHDRRQGGGELEPLRAVPWLVDGEQVRLLAVIAGQDGERRAGLARELGGDEHQGAAGQVHVPAGLGRHRPPGAGPAPRSSLHTSRSASGGYSP